MASFGKFLACNRRLQCRNSANLGSDERSVLKSKEHAKIQPILGLLALGGAYSAFAGVTAAIATIADKRCCAKEPRWFNEAMEKLLAIPAADDTERFVVCECFIAEPINGPGAPTSRQRIEALAAYRLTARRRLYMAASSILTTARIAYGSCCRIPCKTPPASPQWCCGLGASCRSPDGLFDDICDTTLFFIPAAPAISPTA